ncbi:MAG: anti-sigma regulatory factor [Firmicutes bacterium]|nr:anti-sigma regulatory factor [Bacillota bacterium]
MAKNANTLAGDTASLSINIQGRDEMVIVTARGAARELSRELGFGIVDQTRIATAISEIIRNVVLYASEGEVQFRVIEENGQPGLEMVVVDQGPGIADVERVLRGGYSTGNGFGRGISGARSLMDDFELQSEVGSGTRVSMRKWLR